jgi:hypothetical protein
MTRLAGRVETPLQHDPLDHDGAGDLAFEVPIGLWADVHQKGTVTLRSLGLVRIEADQT